MYLIDTDVVVSYLNGRADAIALVNQLLPDGIAISVMTLGELYEGVYFGPDPARQTTGLHTSFHKSLAAGSVAPASRRLWACPAIQKVFNGIWYQNFLRVVRVININRRVAQQFGRLRGLLRRQGQLLPAPDLLIAATATTYRLILVTRNLRHFQRVPGLQLYQWP